MLWWLDCSQLVQNRTKCTNCLKKFITTITCTMSMVKTKQVQNYLLTMHNDVKYLLYYACSIFCITDIHSRHIGLNIWDVQNAIFIYTTGQKYYHHHFKFILAHLLLNGSLMACPDCNKWSKQCPRALYELCVQCLLVWSLAALWPTCGLGATEGCDLIPS